VGANTSTCFTRHRLGTSRSKHFLWNSTVFVCRSAGIPLDASGGQSIHLRLALFGRVEHFIVLTLLTPAPACSWTLSSTIVLMSIADGASTEIGIIPIELRMSIRYPSKLALELSRAFFRPEPYRSLETTHLAI